MAKTAGRDRRLDGPDGLALMARRRAKQLPSRRVPPTRRYKYLRASPSRVRGATLRVGKPVAGTDFENFNALKGNLRRATAGARTILLRTRVRTAATRDENC